MPEGVWLRAERQARGRGRQGRAWVSPPGNLYASTLVRLLPGDPPAPTLALVAAVALHEAISAFFAIGHPHPTLALNGKGSGPHIKWPNDLLLGDAKLSGILLERSGDAVVVGFGVNLAHHPGDLGRAATSLAAATGAAPDPDTVLAALADTFARWLARWRSDGLAPIRAAWLVHAHPIGTRLTVKTPFVPSEVEGCAPSAASVRPTSTALGANAGERTVRDIHTLDGRFDGLDEGGALRLRLADGTARVIHAADVFLVQD